MTTAATAGPLDDLQWSKRVLLVFSTGTSAEFDAQARLLAAIPPEETDDRDLLVLLVPPNGSVRTLRGSASREYRAADLRKHWNVLAGDEFTVILLGKDGGEKLRKSRPVGLDEIFALIDSMPMRAREMRGNRLPG